MDKRYFFMLKIYNSEVPFTIYKILLKKLPNKKINTTFVA